MKSRPGQGATTLAQGTRGPLEAAIRTLFEGGVVAGRSDGELLDLFLAAGGPAAEVAFAALVERHGPMVWRSAATCSASRTTPTMRSRRRSSASPVARGHPQAIIARILALRRRPPRRPLGPEAGGAAPESGTACFRVGSRREPAADVDRLDAGADPPRGGRPATGKIPHAAGALLLRGPDARPGREPARLAGRYRAEPPGWGPRPAPATAPAEGSRPFGRDPRGHGPRGGHGCCAGRPGLGDGRDGGRGGRSRDGPGLRRRPGRDVLREMTIMKLSMIATGLVAATLVGTAGLGYVAVAGGRRTGRRPRRRPRREGHRRQDGPPPESSRPDRHRRRGLVEDRHPHAVLCRPDRSEPPHRGPCPESGLSRRDPDPGGPGGEAGRSAVPGRDARGREKPEPWARTGPPPSGASTA